MLCATVGSVHKLSFPHPSRLEAAGAGAVEGGLVSVLAEASAATAREQQHSLSWPSSTPLPSSCCSCYTPEEEAVFVLANTSGQLTCVRLGRVRGLTSVHPLQAPSSVLGRVWSSLTGAQQQERGDQPTSCCLASVPGAGPVVLAVCRDHRLRVWSLASYECVMTQVGGG